MPIPFSTTFGTLPAYRLYDAVITPDGDLSALVDFDNYPAWGYRYQVWHRITTTSWGYLNGSAPIMFDKHKKSGRCVIEPDIAQTLGENDYRIEFFLVKKNGRDIRNAYATFERYVYYD